MTRASTLSVLLALGGLACAPAPIIGEDVLPLDGALHLTDMGQAEAFGRNPDAGPPTSDAPPSENGVAALEAAVRDLWVHRQLHAEEGIDPDAVIDLLREETAAAQGRGEKRAALRRATCRLGDGQLQLVERDGTRFADSGVSVRAVGPAFLVDGTDDRYGGDLGPGDAIMEVDGADVVRWSEMTCAGPGSTDGQRRALLAQSLERAPESHDEGRRRAKTLTVRRAKSGKVREVKLQWREEGERTTMRCASGEAITGEVGTITVHRLDCDPATFERELTAAADAAGSGHVLLDLRRVIGDDEANAQLLARRFSPASTVWATKRPGTSGGFPDVPLPETGPPIQASSRWLLTSPRCAGNCELAAAVIAADELVTAVGRATAGSVAETKPVSVGKGFTVRVPIVQYALPGTATLIEGRGVTPDIAVTATVDMLKRGHDPEVMAVARRIAGKD